MDQKVIEEAIAWHDAQKSDDADWAGFVTWLEADPRHREVYDDIALLDDAVVRHRGALARRLRSQPSADQTPRQKGHSRRWWIGIGVGIAAAVAVLVSLPLAYFGSPDALTYKTGLGQSQSIALNDGSHIELAAASELVVSGRHQEDMRLKGSAYFDIRHDPSRKLVIRADGYEVRDIGTRFDVSSGAGGIRVAVAEGQVSVKAAGVARPVQLQARQQLMMPNRQALPEIVQVAPEDVGSWRKGRLVYQNAPLSLVTAEISRYAGRPVSADHSIADRRFSGVLAIGDGSGLVDNLQQFMDLEMRMDGDSIRLVAPRGK